MAKQRLNGTDIVIGLQKMGSEGVTEGMGGDFFGDFRFSYGMIECALELCFMKVVTASLTGFLHYCQCAVRRSPALCPLSL